MYFENNGCFLLKTEIMTTMRVGVFVSPQYIPNKQVENFTMTMMILVMYTVMTMRIEAFCGFDHEPSKRGGGSEKEEYFTGKQRTRVSSKARQDKH